MIRIRILKKEDEDKLQGISKIRKAEKERLEKLITGIKPKWLEDAIKKTEGFGNDHCYKEEAKDHSWGDIKEVYMELQAYKCAYCEQRLPKSSIMHDVEHYRPKSNVRIWLTEKRKKSLEAEFPHIKIAFLDAPHEGYYLLPYNIFNYITACKHCNTILKKDFFPIAGTRLNDKDDFEIINKSEKPLLIYPLGHIDEDSPEELITFNGFAPGVNPNLKNKYKILRAIITIKFFNLDTNEDLLRERWRLIKDIYEAVEFIDLFKDNDNLLKKFNLRKNAVEIRENDLRRWTNDANEHKSCAQNFLDLCLGNPDERVRAKDHYDAANKYLDNHLNKETLKHPKLPSKPNQSRSPR